MVQVRCIKAGIFILMVLAVIPLLCVNANAQWSTGTGGIYYNSGNVAIGKTSASQKLDVNGNAVIMGPSFNGNGQQAVLYLGDMNNSICGEYGFGLRLCAPSISGYTNYFVIRSNGGYVGIGIDNPGSRLQVNGNASIGYSSSQYGPQNGLAVYGSVSIGISSPGYPQEKLHVLGNSRFESGQLRFFTGSADASGITGIVGNPNGWTRLDPGSSTSSRFIIPISSMDVGNAKNIRGIVCFSGRHKM